VGVESAFEDPLDAREETLQTDPADISFLAEEFEPLVVVAVLLAHALLPELEAFGALVGRFLPASSQPHHAAYPHPY
jgi:hypothetical protein